MSQPAEPVQHPSELAVRKTLADIDALKQTALKQTAHKNGQNQRQILGALSGITAQLLTGLEGLRELVADGTIGSEETRRQYNTGTSNVLICRTVLKISRFQQNQPR